jgi:rare lipoprotein A (peptidoglycan hydrolase)
MNSELLPPRRRGVSDCIDRPLLITSMKIAVLVAVGVGVAACGSTPARKSGPSAHINNKTKFSVRDYGVKASPRVTTSRRVRRGGGRAQIGKPYKVRGEWYKPREQPGYNKVGNASWYGPNFHGRLTANGEVYDQYSLSGAHPTFPLPSYARVTNLANGNSVVVRVNDRGPYAHGRVIDMSSKAADLLDYKRKGIARVRVQYLGKARLDGRDQRFLLASYKPGKGYKRYKPALLPGGFPGVMIASRRSEKTVGGLPVSSFVKAPYPKPRPVFTGGIPINIQASRQQEIFEPIEQRIKNAIMTQTELEPLSPAVKDSLKDRYIISSYAAGLRVSNAHRAASEAILLNTDITRQNIRFQKRWKYLFDQKSVRANIDDEPHNR